MSGEAAGSPLAVCSGKARPVLETALVSRLASVVPASQKAALIQLAALAVNSRVQASTVASA